MPRSFNSFSSQKYEADVAPATAPPIAISLWMYGNATSFMYPCGLADKDVTNMMFAPRSNSNGTFGMRTRDASTDNNIYASNTGNASGWNHHFLLWASSTSRTCWTNGDSANKATSTTSVSPSGIDRFTIGGVGDSSPDYFSGGIAHVCIWGGTSVSSFFTDSVVAALAKGLPVWNFLPDCILSYYPMWGTDATVLKDYGPLGNHLSQTNSPTIDNTSGQIRVMWGGRPTLVARPVSSSSFKSAWAVGATQCS